MTTTASIQAAVANGGPVELPAGTIDITSTIVLDRPVRITGAGRGATVLRPAPGVTPFKIYTPDSCQIEDLAIVWDPNTAQANTYGIIIDCPPGACNMQSIVENVAILEPRTGIVCINGAQTVFQNVRIKHYIEYGMWIENRFQVDTGDYCVSDCFVGGIDSAHGTGIMQLSAGGMKVTNTKFIKCLRGYHLALGAGVATSDLLVSNCSIEQFGGQGILIERQDSRGSFANVILNGCQLLASSGASHGILVQDGFGRIWLSSVLITDCVVAGPPTPNFAGISVAFVDGLVVTANIVKSTQPNYAIGYHSCNHVICNNNVSY